MLDLLLLLLSLCRPARLLRWGIFLAGMLVLWLVVEKSTLHDYFAARARYNSYYEQVQRLQSQQKQYQTELTEIKAGGFRLEKTIREQLPLIRPGERVIYIETPADRESAAKQQRPLQVREAVESAPEADSPKGAKMKPAADEAETEKPAGKKTTGKTAGRTGANEAQSPGPAGEASATRREKSVKGDAGSGKSAGKTAAKANATKSSRTKKKAPAPAAD